MMRIYDGRESFYQWDSNQKLIHPNFKVGDEVHISNMKTPVAPVLVAYELDNKVVVDVPNCLLQSSYPIYVYWMNVDANGRSTRQQYVFTVEQRPKPDDYVYTETEVLTWKALDERLKKVEDNTSGVDEEAIANAVENYMDKHPVNASPKQMEVKIVNGVASHTPAQIFAHVQAGGDAITYGLIGMMHRLDTIRETLAVFNCNNINTTGVTKFYVVIAENGKVTTGQNDYNPSVPTTLPNPNALTFTGAVVGSYDGSKALSVNIPETYGKSEIDAIMGSYITDIDTLVGGGS